MTLLECREKIDDLKRIRILYNTIYFDRKSTFYKCPNIYTLSKKTEQEIARIEEMIYLREYDDSLLYMEY